MFYYSLIGPVYNYMFLQDLSLLINRKNNLVYPVILSKKFNGFGREKYLHPIQLTTEEMPVAMTTRVMARSVLFFKILNLVGRDFQLTFFPFIGR